MSGQATLAYHALPPSQLSSRGDTKKERSEVNSAVHQGNTSAKKKRNMEELERLLVEASLFARLPFLAQHPIKWEHSTSKQDAVIEPDHVETVRKIRTVSEEDEETDEQLGYLRENIQIPPFPELSGYGELKFFFF